jgi:ElaB/YqjD/DUF883 family membrane-anchored ribosome-binding protein
MSPEIQPVTPTSSLRDTTKDLARFASDEVKTSVKNISVATKDMVGEAEELAGEISHSTLDAAKNVADKAKDLYHTAADKAGDTLASTKDYVRKNPMSFVIGSLFLGAAVGYLIINARRKPTFAERFADEPMVSVRDAIRDAFTPAANRVHESYDSARQGVGKVMDQVHRLRPGHSHESLSDRISRTAHNLKFW